MIILLIRFLLIFYFVGVLVLVLLRMGGLMSKKSGVLAIILFPLMLLTEKGRKNLKKGL